jgi:hypothetical protein
MESLDMPELNENNSPLNKDEISLLNQMRGLKPSLPPEPWGNRVIVAASGVIASGWDKSENILLISTDGYSLSDSSSGTRVSRDRDREKTFDSILPSYLQFRLTETQEIIDIFGVNGGDGIHRTKDGWTLKTVYPWWPHESVILKPPFVPGSGRHGLLDDAYMIELQRLTGWLKCGFSPAGKYFAIVGSAGAEIFSRSTR